LGNRKKILEHVKGPDILEVAIGTGRNLEFYPPNSRIVGIDLSEGMLEQVKAKIQKLFGAKNEKNIQVTTVLMDAHNMKFQDNQFDTGKQITNLDRDFLHQHQFSTIN
jgi:phosphatidylethanolamine/phosphatidyl-N-methylethanolamine N-methyltransferase